MAYIDPDGRLVWFLLPIAISMAADYCLPAAMAALQPCLGIEAVSLLAGFVKGYNADFFEPSFTEASGYHYLGMAMGGALNLLPGKAASNVASKGSQLAASVAAKELSGAAANTIATKASKWFSWFKPSAAPISQTAQKTAQAAEKHLVKDSVTEVVKKSGRNRLVADANATGAHTVFRRDSLTRKVTHYETFSPQTNFRNPNPWESVIRFDNSGKFNQSHFNKILDKHIYEPHVHDPIFPGGIRPAQPWEIP